MGISEHMPAWEPRPFAVPRTDPLDPVGVDQVPPALLRSRRDYSDTVLHDSRADMASKLSNNATVTGI